MNWPIRKSDSYPALWNAGGLHRSIDDLLEDFFGGYGVASQTGGLVPKFDVFETDHEVVVDAELPGMDEKDVQVTLQNNILTIKGEKKKSEETKKKNCYIAERSYGSFQRSLQLGSGVDEDGISATFKKGVLTLKIPKTEPEKNKARSIEVKSE